MILMSVKNIGKAYRSYRSEWQRFASWFGFKVTPKNEKWVLRHIDFDVQAGEAIGLMGHNGAGKSTLLKIIAGTLKSSEGNINIKGRIAAILELGMGFNPELTGRQNAIHAIGLMGYSYEDIIKIINEVENFAEIGDYFNQPVRTYSSGMQARVAFAVATAFRPDILIVDEALSVGDTYFRHKSFERIRNYQSQGTTLIIVTHDISSVLTLCNRALLLENGSVIKDASPKEVVDLYNAIIAEKENSTVQVKKLKDGSAQTVSGTGEALISEFSLCNDSGKPIEFISVGEKACLCVNVNVIKDVSELVLGYQIKDRLGLHIFGTNTFYLNKSLYNLNSGEFIKYKILFPMNLGVGSYSVTLALHSTENHLQKNYHWIDKAILFNVVNPVHAKFIGVAWVPPILEIEK